MRTHAAILAALFLAAFPAHSGSPERYMVLRQQVTLASAPGDDMRPKIVGTVIAADPAGVTLEGGAHVPAAARVGDLATFACQSIDDDSPPASRDCELVRSQPPAEPKRGGVSLWD